MPGLLNSVHQTEYGCSEPKVVDGIWIMPCINSDSHGFCVPLIFSYTQTGEPFTIGVTVLDYEVQNDIECTELVLTALVATIDGEKTSVQAADMGMSAPFKRYYSGTSSVSADCYVNFPDLADADPESVIRMEATVQIHTSKGVVTESVSGEFDQGGWRGEWTIWEALAPHA